MYVYAGVLLLTKDNKIALQVRGTDTAFYPGQVSLFGGGLEKDEEPIQGAIREIQEELGIALTEADLEPFGVYEKNAEKYGHEGVCHIFLVRDIVPSQFQLNEGEGIVFLGKDDELSKFPLTVLARELVTEFWNKQQ